MPTIKEARVIVSCPGRNFVTLKIETDQGLYGIGDATLNGRELAVLSYLQEHVVPVDTASGRIYRLQAAVGDEGRARSICNSLRNRGQACVAVLPH